MLLQCDSNEHPHWTRSTLIPTSCPGSISIFAASISIVCWLQSQIYSSEFVQTCDFRDLLLADISVSIIHGHTFATNPKVDGQTCEKTSCSPGRLPELGVNLCESPLLPLSQTPQRPCCALNGKCQELRHLLHPFIDPRPAKKLDSIWIPQLFDHLQLVHAQNILTRSPIMDSSSCQRKVLHVKKTKKRKTLYLL